MANFYDIISDNKPVLVDFYADWCQPCKMVAPILKQVKNEMGDKIKIIKINVDNNPVVASKYNIRSIPTLMLFKQGELKYSQAGVMPAQQIRNIIMQNL